MLDNKGNTHYNTDAVGWPYKYTIAKSYLNTFDLRNATNPYTELKKNNVPEEDIPLILNIPKSIDITEQRTITQNLNIPVPDPLKKKRYIYIASLVNGIWKIQSWGSIDPNSSTATFEKMGVEMLYHMASFHKGKTNLIGSPFIVDSTGNISYLTISGNPFRLKISQSGESSPIQFNDTYDIYYWNRDKSSWNKIVTKMAETDTLNITSPYSNTIYRIVDNTKPGTPGNMFTMKGDKQIWW
jgi:hypothetical protein